MLTAFALTCAAACNLITGASDLGVCGGAACDSLGGMPTRDGDGGRDGARADGSTLPATCNDGESACDGNAAATCVGSTWQRTACAETCENGRCLVFPSCRGQSGGGCGTAKDDCCTPIAVPGGTFDRRNDKDLPATVNAFALDKYEVTVGRFRAFVAAGGATRQSPPQEGAGEDPLVPGSGWRPEYVAYLPTDVGALRASLAGSGATWTDEPGANELRPINRVSWALAFAFCAWDKGRLPTYAEWSFAAAGGDEQRVYPWSSPASSTTIAATNAAYDCGYTAPPRTCPASYCSTDKTMSPCNTTSCAALAGTCVTPPCTGCSASVDIAPVGALPGGAGRWGHLDLAGNVAEMLLDADQSPPVPCTDCARVPTLNNQGRLRDPLLVVGGGWSDTAAALQVTDHDSISAGDTDDAVGVRCAR